MPHLPPSPDTLLDASALVLFFPAPHTVTGENVLELHVHGGRAVVRAVLAAIPQCALSSARAGAGPRIRYAEAGEFSYRAFANHRMDLPQIESLGEVLSAATEQQRKLSVRGTTSSLAARYEQWRQLLLQARGELEALIDFSEDQQLEASPRQLCASIADQVAGLRAQMAAHMENAVRGELMRNGISVALLGAPNAGKSSLLNRIVGREAAIVSQEAGTTRDIVEVAIDLKGWLVRMGDMAGLRNTGSPGSSQVGAVEAEGIRRARQRALGSDVVIVVQDATTAMDAEVLGTAQCCLERGVQVLVAINKIDRVKEAVSKIKDEWIARLTANLAIPPHRIAFISCAEEEAMTTTTTTMTTMMTTTANIQDLLQNLIVAFGQMTSAINPDSAPDPSVWQEGLGATERQRSLLSDCLGHLDAFLLLLSVHAPPPAAAAAAAATVEEVDIVVAAEALRSAADALASVTGRGASGDVEEVLGVVFEKFCVGK